MIHSFRRTKCWRSKKKCATPRWIGNLSPTETRCIRSRTTSAGNDNSKGAAYNEKADLRSWREMKSFLDEALR